MAIAVAAGMVLTLLGACATEAPVPVPVEVPVPVYCEPRAVARPAMPTETLADDADVFVVARALWAELEVRDGYEALLLDALEQCKKKGAAEAP